jgi:ketosteroid isomerase-like protein
MKLPLPHLLIASLILLLPARAANRTIEAEVIAAEQSRVTALIQDDFAALDRLLSDDLTYTHSNALVDSKAQYIESLRSGRLKYKALDHEQQHVRVYGDTAVLTGLTRVYSIYQGQEGRPTLRFTIVYVKKSGRWQMAAWQSTRVP